MVIYILGALGLWSDPLDVRIWGFRVFTARLDLGATHVMLLSASFVLHAGFCMSQGFYHGLVNAIMGSSGNDMSVSATATFFVASTLSFQVARRTVLRSCYQQGKRREHSISPRECTTSKVTRNEIISTKHLRCLIAQHAKNSLPLKKVTSK